MLIPYDIFHQRLYLDPTLLLWRQLGLRQKPTENRDIKLQFAPLVAPAVSPAIPFALHLQSE
jgi:hypothetical protein